MDRRVRLSALGAPAVLALAVLALAAPAPAAADPAVDAAVAGLASLRVPPVAGMPSGRTSYRSIGDYDAEMAALARTHPGLVAVRTAPYPTRDGRPVRYLEIGRSPQAPALFVMGLHHGNEKPAGEDTLEFAYDVVGAAAADPAVAALLERVRIVDLPVVNPDGFAAGRRRDALDVDLNRNYPLGWRPGASAGAAPASEPEVRDVMAIAASHQLAAVITNHTFGRTILYPPLQRAAGPTPDDHAALAQAMARATGYRSLCSACDYETAGETIDWTYYTTRALSYTIEEQPAAGRCSGYAPADYAGCVAGEYDTVRKAFWLALVYASLPAAHAVIEGTAPAGARLTLSRDFTEYTDAPPQAVPTHVESSLTVPAGGRFRWAVEPSVRPLSAYTGAGIVTGPNGFAHETATLACGSARTLLTLDRGTTSAVAPCAARAFTLEPVSP